MNLALQRQVTKAVIEKVGKLGLYSCETALSMPELYFLKNSPQMREIDCRFVTNVMEIMELLSYVRSKRKGRCSKASN